MAEKTEKVKWERIYTIPLSGLYKGGIHTLRSKRASKEVRAFIAKHSGLDASDITFSNAINDCIWSFGGQRPPRAIKVKIIKEAGKATATLLGEEETAKKKSDKEKAKADRKKQKPAAKAAAPKKEEKKAESAKKEETAEEKENREKLEKIAHRANM